MRANERLDDIISISKSIYSNKQLKDRCMIR